MRLALSCGRYLPVSHPTTTPCQVAHLCVWWDSWAVLSTATGHRLFLHRLAQHFAPRKRKAKPVQSDDAQSAAFLPSLVCDHSATAPSLSVATDPGAEPTESNDLDSLDSDDGQQDTAQYNAAQDSAQDSVAQDNAEQDPAQRATKFLAELQNELFPGCPGMEERAIQHTTDQATRVDFPPAESAHSDETIRRLMAIQLGWSAVMTHDVVLRPSFLFALATRVERWQCEPWQLFRQCLLSKRHCRDDNHRRATRVTTRTNISGRGVFFYLGQD